jgi:hypothetical protein
MRVPARFGSYLLVQLTQRSQSNVVRFCSNLTHSDIFLIITLKLYSFVQEVTFMFDTLTIVADCSIPEEGLQRMMNQKTRVAYLNPGEEEDVTTFSYHLKADPILPYLKYNKEKQRATITVPCCSYFMFGYRMKRMDDSHIPGFLTMLQQAFVDELQVCFTRPVAEWKLRNGDAYYDFTVSDTGAYVQGISQGCMSRYEAYNYPFQTAGFQCESRDIKFYDKRAKLLRDRVRDQRDIELSTNKLRFEVAVKPYDMQKNVGSQSLGHVLSNTFVNEHLEKYLRRLNLFNVTITTERQIVVTLTRYYDEKWAVTLLGYIVGRTNGIKMENQRLETKYIKMITEAGIAPIIGNEVLPPLLLPWMHDVTRSSLLTLPVTPVVPRKLDGFGTYRSLEADAITLKTSIISNTTFLIPKNSGYFTEVAVSLSNNAAL